MQLTDAWTGVIPTRLQERYRFREVRNASAVLQSSAGHVFDEVLEVLDEFALGARDLVLPGGNESTVAKALNAAFRRRGWREARVDTVTTHTLVVFPYRLAGEDRARAVESEPVAFEGYKADWVKDRVAGDCEWNAKDGNLDRDLASYRSLYDTGFIDAAVLITRTQEGLRELERELVAELLATADADAAASLGTTPARVAMTRRRLLGGDVKGRLDTTTTTNLDKLTERMKRGDAGGCPLLAIAISRDTWDGSHVRIG